jgi:hypothetical protein
MVQSVKVTLSDMLSTLLGLVRNVWVRRGWFVLLALFTLAVGAFTLSNRVSLLSYLALLFYAFVPGYSFVEATLSKVKWHEKFMASVLFSISFLMGIKALDRTLALQTGSAFSFLSTSPFDYGLDYSLTLILIAYLTWKAFRPGTLVPLQGKGSNQI